MANRRDFSVFVLVTHLMVSLPTGSIAFEKNLPQKISIENESTETANKVSKNVNSNGETNNSSMILETTSGLPSGAMLLKEEQKLEDELVQVLKNVRASGQTLIVITSTGVENSTEQIVQPLIIIEGSSTTMAPSSINYESARSESTIDPTSTNFDQDISQTQSRTRSSPRDHVNGEHDDNIDHISAVTEYEPQKIDAQEIDDKTGDETRRDGPSRQDQSSTGHQSPEGSRYDVIWRRNLPTHFRKPDEYTTEKPTSRQLKLAASQLPSIRNERTRTSHGLPEPNYKTGKRQVSLPLTFREKSIVEPGVERLRGPRHSNPSPPSLSSTGKLVTHLPENLERHLGYSIINDSDVDNITNGFQSSGKKFHNSPIVVSHAPLLPMFREIRQKRVYVDGEKTHHAAKTGEKRELPQMADERMDGYSSTGYQAKPSKHQVYNVSDAQLKFLARYNLPSVILPRSPRPPAHSPDAATHGQKIFVTGNSREEEDNDPGYATETEDRIGSRSDELAHDYYQDAEEKSPIKQSASSDQFGKQIDRFVDPVDEAIMTAYNFRGDTVQTKTSNLYGNDVKSIPTPIYENYEDYGTTVKPKSIKPQQSLHSTMKQRQSLPTTSNIRVDIPTRLAHQPQGYPADAPRMKLLNEPIEPIEYEINHLGSTPFPSPNTYTHEKRPKPKLKLPSKHLVTPGVSYNSYEGSENMRPSSSVIDEQTGNGDSVDDSYDRFVNLRTVPSILAEENVGDRPYREKNTIHHSPHSTNLYGSSSSSSLAPRVINLRGTSGPSAEIPKSVTSFADTNKNYQVGVKEIHSLPDFDQPVVGVTVSRKENKHRTEELIGKHPDYDFYEHNQQVDVYSPAVTGRTSQTLISSDDESQAGPSMVQGLEESLRPRSSALTFRVKPAESINRNDQLNEINRNDKRRITSAESNEEPAESNEEPAASVHRVDVEEVASLRDETPSHENYETHAESKKEKVEDEESEKGGGEKHLEGHRASDGEKGEKGYKEWHEYDKGKKGHSDSEHHENEYDESKGSKKKHDNSSGYHKEHSHGEKASKESEFGEKGEHQKGHSTKGQHVVHKNDEYEKKTEFYDESHEEDGDEKEGEYRYDHEDEKGGHEKIGHHDLGYHADKYGKKGEHEKGRHWDETEGHDEKDGSELEHSYEEKYGKKSAHEEGEEWSRQNGDKETR